MTRPIVLAVLTSALAVSACATGPANHPTYGQQLDQLSADCVARGGILAPVVGGGQTGRPQTDYTCNITGGASRLTRGG